MYEGKLVFAQLMDHLPMHTFRRIVARFDGDKSVKSFSCQDQFRAMAFAQLTWRDSLRDTVIGLNSQGHVWTTPALQGNSDMRLAVGCKSCVRPVVAAHDRWP